MKGFKVVNIYHNDIHNAIMVKQTAQTITLRIEESRSVIGKTIIFNKKTKLAKGEMNRNKYLYYEV